EEQLGIIEILLKFRYDPARIIRSNCELKLEQRYCGVQHRFVSDACRRVNVAGFKLELRLEGFALAGCQLEIDRRHDLAGAFSHSHVACRELARVRPVTIEGRVVLVARDLAEIIDHFFAFRFADPRDKPMKGFTRPAMIEISLRDAVYCFRNTL